MAVSLQKGGNVSLTKAAPGLTKVIVGLGWDARTTDGAQFDLDASAIACGTDGKAVSDRDFVFYGSEKNANGHFTNPSGTITHSGDNLTGEGAGDDEQITIDLAGIDAGVDKVVLPVTIYEADTRGLSFGMVRNAFIRIVNADDGTEIARYDLSEDASSETGMVFGEVYRNDGGWKFRAVGQGYSAGLAGIIKDFGVTV